MWNCFIFLLIVLLFCDTRQEFERIVNGNDAKIQDFPYIVSLRRYNYHVCGAAIISPRFVLTAAHCVCSKTTHSKRLPAAYSIQYDSTFISIYSKKTVQVANITCHQHYNVSKNSAINDIAIIKLKHNIPKGRWRPIDLPSPNGVHRLFHHGMVAGWGRKTQKGSPSRRLQKLFIEIFDEELCQRLFFDEHLICIGSYEEGGGNCFGDSGGPLIVSNVLLGISSFVSRKCGYADAHNPSGYTNTSYYLEWIQQNMY